MDLWDSGRGGGPGHEGGGKHALLASVGGSQQGR